MKLILTAILIGLSGVGIGYWRFQQSTSVKLESFIDPLERIKKEAGVEFSENDISSIPRAKLEVVGGKEFNFGKMQAGTERSHAFVLRNIGNAKTNLKVNGTTCKCTLGDLDKSVLEPGEETKVLLTWKALTRAPEFSQTATIGTDDPDQTELKLVVRGLISETILFEPNEIAIGDVSSRDRVQRKFTLLSCHEKPLEISEIRWASESTQKSVHTKYSIRKIAPGEIQDREDVKYVADIELEIDSGLPLGTLNSKLFVTTNILDDPLEIGVNGFVVGPVRIIGGLNFDDSRSLLQMGTDRKAKISLGVRFEEGFEPKVEAIAVRPEGFIRVHLDMEKAIRRPTQWIIPVELEVPEDSKPLSLNGSNPSNFGKVEFRTNIEFSPVVPMYITLEVVDR